MRLLYFVQLNCDYGNSYPQPEVDWVIAASVDATGGSDVALGSRMQLDLLGNLHFMNVETVSYPYHSDVTDKVCHTLHVRKMNELM